jgi:hypothetical protein
VIGLAVAGLVLSVFVLFFEPLVHAAAGLVGLELAHNFTKAEWHFIRRDQTALWLLLLCGQAALWAALLNPLMRTLRELRPWHRRRTALLGAGWFILAFAALSGVTAAVKIPDYDLPGHGTKLVLLTLLAGVVSYLGALGIWRVDNAASDPALDVPQPREPTTEPPAATGQIDRYLHLRDALDRLLVYMGAIVSSAVLAAGALRNAVVSWHPDADFAEERVLLYGLFLSALLALIYIPPFQRLRTLGARLRDAHAPPIWPPHPDWRKRAEERATLGDLLRLDVTPSASLGAGLAILAPLASSMVARLLGG